MPAQDSPASGRDPQRPGNAAGWVTAIVLVVACAVVGYLADGLAAAAFMATLAVIGAAIGVAWWSKAGRKRYG